MRDVIVATENKGKLGEIRSLLGNTFDRYYCLKDFPETVVIDEDSPLYVENAMKKARKVGDLFGFFTLADDSGLEVEALQGRPGVYSSRYGKNDEGRVSRLLAELDGVIWEQRKAAFKAYTAFYMPGQDRCYVFFGRLDGYIGFERHGEGGFGYDPVFYEPELKKYLAELTTEQKNAVSHRGRAITALKEFLNVEFFRRPRVSNL